MPTIHDIPTSILATMFQLFCFEELVAYILVCKYWSNTLYMHSACWANEFADLDMFYFLYGNRFAHVNQKQLHNLPEYVNHITTLNFHFADSGEWEIAQKFPKLKCLRLNNLYQFNILNQVEFYYNLFSLKNIQQLHVSLHKTFDIKNLICLENLQLLDLDDVFEEQMYDLQCLLTQPLEAASQKYFVHLKTLMMKGDVTLRLPNKQKVKFLPSILILELRTSTGIPDWTLSNVLAFDLTQRYTNYVFNFYCLSNLKYLALTNITLYNDIFDLITTKFCLEHLILDCSIADNLNWNQLLNFKDTLTVFWFNFRFIRSADSLILNLMQMSQLTQMVFTQTTTDDAVNLILAFQNLPKLSQLFVDYPSLSHESVMNKVRFRTTTSHYSDEQCCKLQRWTDQVVRRLGFNEFDLRKSVYRTWFKQLKRLS